MPPVLFTLTQVVLLLITSTFTRVQIQSNLGTTVCNTVIQLLINGFQNHWGLHHPLLFVTVPEHQLQYVYYDKVTVFFISKVIDMVKEDISKTKGRGRGGTVYALCVPDYGDW